MESNNNICNIDEVSLRETFRIFGLCIHLFVCNRIVHEVPFMIFPFLTFYVFANFVGLLIIQHFERKYFQ